MDGCLVATMVRVSLLQGKESEQGSYLGSSVMVVVVAVSIASTDGCGAGSTGMATRTKGGHDACSGRDMSSSCGCYGRMSARCAMEQSGPIDSSSGYRGNCAASCAGSCGGCAGVMVATVVAGREHGFQAGHGGGFVVGALYSDGFAVE